MLDFPAFSCYTVLVILSVKNGRAMGAKRPFFGRNNMKQKVLSLFLSLALLCSAMPLTLALSASADETAPTDGTSKSGIKLGLSDGDIVYFAGKDEPMAWRVLDADKANTGDENGVFLLSDSTLYNESDVYQYPDNYLGLQTGYKAFFEKYFPSPYDTAALAVTTTDEDYAYSSAVTMHGELSNDTVFALSIAEARALSDEVRAIGSMWWLRSMQQQTVIPFPYYIESAVFSQVESNGTIASSSAPTAMNVYLRPAVNLKKSALSVTFGEKEGALLLPLDTSASDGSFAAYEDTGEYMLCMKDENTSLLNAYTLGHPKTEARVFIDTSLMTAGENDYVSFILMKADGTISHFARFKLEKGSGYFLLTLPTDVDLQNDSLYAFHETVNGAFSSLISEPKKLCLTHVDGTYKNLSERSHRVTCALCGSLYDRPHVFTVDKKAYTDETHTERCSLCGYEHEVSHTLQCTYSDDYNHILSCTDCNYELADHHAFSFTKETDVEGLFDGICVCGKESGISAKAGTLPDTLAVPRAIYKNGSALVGGGAEYTSGAKEALFDPQSGGAIFEANPSSNGYRYLMGFDTVSENCLYGITLRNGKEMHEGEADFSIPTALLLEGLDSSRKTYETVAQIPLEGFIKRAAGEEYSFLFGQNTKKYSTYRLSFTGNTKYLLCGSISFLSRSAAQPTFALSGAIVSEKSDCIAPYEDYVCTLLSRMGHPAASDVSVLCGDESYDNYVYDEESGKLTLPAENRPEEKEFTIRASAGDDTVLVGKFLNRLTFDGAGEARFGVDYVGTFTDSDGKKRFVPQKGDDCIITVDGVPLTDYTLVDGVLTIPGKYITGDMTVTAYEAGSVRKDSSAVCLSELGSIPRYFDSLSEAKSYLDKSGATLTLLRDIAEEVSFDRYSLTIDLGGFTWQKSYSRNSTPILTVTGSAKVTLRNGTFSDLMDVYPLLTASATVVIEKDIVLRSFPSCTGEGDKLFAFLLQKGAVLTVKGAVLQSLSLNNAYTDHYHATAKVENGATVVVEENGRVNSLVLEPSAKAVFTEGNIFDFLVRFGDEPVDYFDCLAEGSVFTNTYKDYFLSYLQGKSAGLLFAPDPGILTEQPQDARVYLGSSAVLSVTASGNDLLYQWSKNGEIIEGATESRYTVPASDTPHTDTYTCSVYSDGYLLRSREAKITFACRHGVFDSYGVCSACGETVLAEISDDNGWTRYTDIDELMSAENALSSGKITLIGDVSAQFMSFRGADTTLDLNRHTLSAREISVYGNLTIRNGTVNAEIASGDFTGGFLTIEDGTYSHVSVTPGHALLKSGKFAFIKDPYSEFDSYLPEGYGYRLIESRTFPDLSDGGLSALENVEIMPLPYRFVSVPADAVLSVGEAKTLEVEIERSDIYSYASLTYQWSEAAAVSYDRYGVHYETTPIEGVTDASFAIPTDIPSGTQKTYACTVSCAGYERTVYATFSFGVGTPVIEDAALRLRSEGVSGDFRINSAGNDCIAVFMLYKDNVLRGVKYLPLSATDFHRIITEQDFGEYWHCDAVRVTVIKDFSSLMPFTKDITVTPQ